MENQEIVLHTNVKSQLESLIRYMDYSIKDLTDRLLFPELKSSFEAYDRYREQIIGTLTGTMNHYRLDRYVKEVKDRNQAYDIKSYYVVPELLFNFMIDDKSDLAGIIHTISYDDDLQSLTFRGKRSTNYVPSEQYKEQVVKSYSFYSDIMEHILELMIAYKTNDEHKSIESSDLIQFTVNEIKIDGLFV